LRAVISFIIILRLGFRGRAVGGTFAPPVLCGKTTSVAERRHGHQFLVRPSDVLRQPTHHCTQADAQVRDARSLEGCTLRVSQG
jgi:hypothetical protein